jgi:hypothetical protein
MLCLPIVSYVTHMIVQLNQHRYLTWASFGKDYLAVMSSSVSSERAFSAAGITIGKRRNRLKGDIVEALQCLKCMLHRNLIFREVVVAEELAGELEEHEFIVDKDCVDTVQEADEFSWDKAFDDEEDEEGVKFVETFDKNSLLYYCNII